MHRPRPKKLKAVKTGSFIQKFDLFGEDVSFRENGQDSFTTNFGALISILVLLLVFAYASKKMSDLVTKNDTK